MEWIIIAILIGYIFYQEKKNELFEDKLNDIVEDVADIKKRMKLMFNDEECLSAIEREEEKEIEQLLKKEKGKK